MKIALIGYGKMGKTIEQIALKRGHSIQLIIDELMPSLDSHLLASAEVAIEFTTPESAVRNIYRCFDANLKVVCGTTGWTDKLPEIQQVCKTEHKTLFYAPNFSIGVNLFFKVNTLLANLMSPNPDFNVEISETHHTQKLDAPSGTAIKLANDITNISAAKKSWTLSPEPRKDEIKISALREGTVFGIHSVTYESETDIIQIKHELKSRESLALGAVIAAEFALKNDGFLTMDNLLKF